MLLVDHRQLGPADVPAGQHGRWSATLATPG
jgi:hypothetical protein